MKVVKGLTKYKKKIGIKKTKGYLEIEKNLAFLKKHRIEIKYKNEYQVQAGLVFLRGLQNKEHLYHLYLLNLNENRELWDQMSYEQRRVLLWGQLQTDLERFYHFYDQEELILIPFYDLSYNHLLTQDYQSVLFKIKKDRLENKIEEYLDPIQTYGIAPLKYGFCDFQWIDQIENNHYLYLEDYHSIYVFDEKTRAFIEVYPFVDKYSHPKVIKEQLKEIVGLFHDNKEKELVQYLYEQHFICDKVYKKLVKKYLGG